MFTLNSALFVCAAASGLVSGLFLLGAFRRDAFAPGRPIPADDALAADVLDAADELRAAVASREAEAANASVTILFALQPGLPLRANRSDLRQVLGDVISNAIAATPHGRVLATCARSASSIVIAVSDDGPPVDENRVDEDRRAGNLRRAAQTCALLGGSLDIEPVPGGGATILLHLPMPAARPEATRIGPVAPPPPARMAT